MLISAIISVTVAGSEVSKNYHFSDYTISNAGDYQLVRFDGCLNTAKSGEPSMPWYAVKLLLPPGEKVVSVTISAENEVSIPGSYLIYPQQASRPLSEGGSGIFLMNQDLYNTDAVYPKELKGKVTTQYMNGHSIALLSICPVRYNPAEGTLSYFEDIRVTVNSERDEKSAEILNMLSSSKAVHNRISGFVQNPEMMNVYPAKSNKSDPYQLLIITTQMFQDEFDELTELYMYRGLQSKVATTEEISANVSGQDLQEKIRNYIIQEYQNSSIEYVLLGGDVEYVPYRGFYCYVESGGGYEDNNIPADLYYNALDGNWNDDGDNSWGEIGEDDLLPELAIGRFSFTNQGELDAMLNKTISYQDDPVLGEFEHPILAGEYLYDNPETWGSDYLRLLIGYREDNGYTTNGIPTTHTIDSLYEVHNSWGTNTIINRINEGRSFIHHVGHANSTYVMHLGMSDITNANFSQVNGTTHNYALLQSHGCICGAFDASDCIMERMVGIDNFAVAVIGNSRYGWFNEGQTEGPAAHLHREMLDAMYNEKMDRIGQAFMECKIQTAPWVTAPGQHEEGALRWNFYDINILGDPTLQIWCDEPFVVNAAFTPPIQIGTTSFDVTVTSNNIPVQGLSCTLTKDGIFHGTSLSDINGQASITIDPPFSTVGTAELTISGYNCQTRTYSIAVTPAGGAFLVYHDHEIDDEEGGNNNGLPDNGESVKMTLNLENAGTVEATNVSATISSLSEYIEIIDNTGHYGNIPAGTVSGTINDFAFSINQFIPDQEIVEFFVDINDDSKENWTDEFSIVLNAPVLETATMYISDNAGGNGNGFLDPGETAVISFDILNNGHAVAGNAVASIDQSSPWINFSNLSVPLGDLEAGSIQKANFELTVEEDAPLGTSVLMVLAVTCSGDAISNDYHTTIGIQVEDWESGDFTNFNWQFEGNAPWIINSSEAYEGQYCAKSGDISDGQESELFLYTEVLADGDLSFYRKVSSEAEWDFLRFYIDDNMVGEWSGELNWEIVSYPVTQGLHTFRWVYEKDGYLSNGDDCAWVDYIVFPPVDIATGIQANDQVQNDLKINIWPNPASSIIHLAYTLDRTTTVDIAIYDLLSHKIADHQQNMIQMQGNHITEIDVSDLKPGIYLCRIKTSAGIQSRKIVVK
jgi:hypothetical protein